MYYCRLIYELCLHKCTSLSQLPHHKGFSASFKISASYPALYQYLLDNPVSGPSFVPTVIAALHSFNRLWAPVCPDLLWHSQATSVDEKDLSGLPTCWGLRWSPCWITSCPQDPLLLCRCYGPWLFRMKHCAFIAASAPWTKLISTIPPLSGPTVYPFWAISVQSYLAMITMSSFPYNAKDILTSSTIPFTQDQDEHTRYSSLDSQTLGIMNSSLAHNILMYGKENTEFL